MKKKILIVVGTRPNFIKVTRFKAIAQKFPNLEIKIVHTGQHYDSKMSDIFFDQFDLVPDYFLNISKGTPASQIAHIILGLEDLVQKTFKPDIMIVPGDVNSTLAASIAANKLGIKLAHLESGLRSFDRTMPEEVNRILTDELSDYYFVTEESGIENLREASNSHHIYFVGNTMIDSIVHFEEKIEASEILAKLEIPINGYVLLTFHRPSNVDEIKGLSRLVELIQLIAENYKIVFPVHPRTINNLKKHRLFNEIDELDNLILTEPLGYFDFQKLVKCSRFVITDSGGIQEETTFRKKPCITIRPNTERPSTIEIGTNTLASFDSDAIKKLIREIENDTYKKGEIPALWDGNATQRILETLNEILK